MPYSQLSRGFSRWYLTLVPFLVAALGFGGGQLRYQVYVPIWGLNVALMVLAAQRLSTPVDQVRRTEALPLVRSAWLLVFPWMLFSIFFGMGPPPATAAGWAAAVTEQQVRYALLMVGGVSATFGLVLLSDCLRQAGETFYSRLGGAAILLAMPLFLLNMTFWGSFLGEAFRQFAATSTPRPDWYAPVRAHFAAISLVEVALTYLATAATAYSLKQVAWLTPKAGTGYVLASAICFCLNLVPATATEPFATAGFVVAIPAIPFVLLYLLGVQLLYRAGNNTV